MQVQLSSGNCDIIASNEVFLFKDTNELTIHINDDDGSRSQLRLRFLEDKSKERRIEAVAEDDYQMVLSCFNFTDRFGSGLIEPALVGDSNGKRVFLIFWTKLDGSKQPYIRSVRFTLFRER